MSDVFISYAKEDRDRARVLAGALEGRGWSVFWDRAIPPGLSWHEYIGREIQESRCILVAWSEAAVQSDWVLEEAGEARKRGVLVPLFLDGVEPPLGFRNLQAADLSGWGGDAEAAAFQQLVQGMERLLGPPPNGNVDEVESDEEQLTQRGGELMPEPQKPRPRHGARPGQNDREKRTSANKGGPAQAAATFLRSAGGLAIVAAVVLGVVILALLRPWQGRGEFLRKPGQTLAARVDWTGSNQWTQAGLDFDVPRVRKSGLLDSYPEAYPPPVDITLSSHEDSIKLTFSQPYSEVPRSVELGAIDAEELGRLLKTSQAAGTSVKWANTDDKDPRVFVLRTDKGNPVKVRVQVIEHNLDGKEDKRNAKLSVQYEISQTGA